METILNIFYFFVGLGILVALFYLFSAGVGLVMILIAGIVGLFRNRHKEAEKGDHAGSEQAITEEMIDKYLEKKVRSDN